MADSTTGGCGLIFIGCDGLMLVGGSSCGLILVVVGFFFFLFFFFFGDCGRNNFSGCGFFFFKFYFNKVVLVVVGLCRGGCRYCCSNGCWWPLLRQ